MLKIIRLFPAFVFIWLMSSNAQAVDPVLNFSDLISGPDTGLGDGLGSGVVVTIWGQYLGSSQTGSAITFTDSANNTHVPAHVYYWKNADGNLPGGPANLYESHRMQEIAISIPNAAAGPGTIHVTVAGAASNTLPFTIRTGEIYHVKSTGSDNAGNGSWANPWRTVDKGDSTATAGDTLYIHDVDTGAYGVDRPIYNNKGFLANTTNQFAYVSFPNTRPTVSGHRNILMYNTTGIVSSKLSVFSSNCPSESTSGCLSGSDGITPSDWGRVIGNKVTDIPGRCASGQSGAIAGGDGNVEGAKIFGNYVHDYSCPNASKLHHTTYMTIRGAPGDPSMEAWEWGWNYLKDNQAKYGIHNYDEDNSGMDACGDLTTDLLIHDNVIVDQSGAGISIASGCGWTQDTHIYNNVLINTGRPSDLDCSSNCGQNGSGITIGDGEGDVYIYNNTIYNWDPENLQDQGTSVACIALDGRDDNSAYFMDNNICYNEQVKPLIGNFLRGTAKLDNFVGSSNAWYFPGITMSDAPSWDGLPTTSDPKLSVLGSQISMDRSSQVIGQGISTPVSRDVYGLVRLPGAEIGAVEFAIGPESPTGVGTD